MANPDFDGASIKLIKRGPGDYQAYVQDYSTGSDTDRGGETVAETLNAVFQWLDLNIELTMG